MRVRCWEFFWLGFILIDKEVFVLGKSGYLIEVSKWWFSRRGRVECFVVMIYVCFLECIKFRFRVTVYFCLEFAVERREMLVGVNMRLEDLIIVSEEFRRVIWVGVVDGLFLLFLLSFVFGDFCWKVGWNVRYVFLVIVVENFLIRK